MQELKQEIRKETPKYVGVGTLKIVGVNPIKEQYNKIFKDLEDKKSVDDDELVYTGIDKDLNQYIDLSFYLSLPMIGAKPFRHTLRLTNTVDRKKDKMVFINKQGASVQALDVDDAIRVHKEFVSNSKFHASFPEPVNYDFKQALKGEDHIIKFIRGLYGLKPWVLFTLDEDDIEKLLTGDLLNFPKAIGLSLVGLLMVTDKGYQTVYKEFYSTNVAGVTGQIKSKLVSDAKNGTRDSFRFQGCFNKEAYNKVELFKIDSTYYSNYLKTSVGASDVAASANIEVGSEAALDLYSMEEPEF